jgi:YVTN family beta-propeller protein
MRRFTLLTTLLAALAVAPAADARVVVVASGDGAATLTDVTTNKVAARVAVGGRTRAAAVAPDGSRGYVAAGTRVVAIDLATRAIAGAANARGTVTAIAASDDGHRLYAARRGAIDVIDAPTMTVIASIALGANARGTALAVSSDATRAVVVLDSKRVGVVDLVRFQLSRRVKLAGATGAAFAATGPNAYVATVARSGSRLLRLNASDGRVTRKIRLGKGLGGGVALTADGRRAVVGSARGAAVTAVVPLAGGKVLRVHTGRGPGVPAASPDGTRIYVADGGSGTVSVLSALSFKRLTAQRIGSGKHPAGVAVQPGVALITGTPGNDDLRGTRGMDRIDALAGDDQLSGGRDDDVLLGGPGNDILDGSPGDDVVIQSVASGNAWLAKHSI